MNETVLWAALRARLEQAEAALKEVEGQPYGSTQRRWKDYMDVRGEIRKAGIHWPYGYTRPVAWGGHCVECKRDDGSHAVDCAAVS